jgi:phosphoribosylanthranilate isomerase
VDGILVEGWKEDTLGGGGAVLDVEALRAVRSEIPAGLDLILAGGLDPNSVAAAVARFSPDVVDVSSGVEVERGRKNRALVRLFIDRVRGAPRMRHPAAPRRKKGRSA